MPRFFFHMHFDAPLIDLDGVELPDVIAARQEALRYAVALVANEAVEVWEHPKWSIRVADEEGASVFHVDMVNPKAPFKTASSGACLLNTTRSRRHRPGRSPASNSRRGSHRRRGLAPVMMQPIVADLLEMDVAGEPRWLCPVSLRRDRANFP